MTRTGLLLIASLFSGIALAADPGFSPPDFSFAGYRRGEAALPERAPEVSVADFGANGADAADDTAAFQKAVAAWPGKVIRVPAGRYVISDIVVIDKSGTVLKGDGPQRSVLVFPKGLEEIRPTPGRTGHGTPTTNWSWSGGFITIRGSPEHGATLTAVVKPGRRGEAQLVVADAAKLRVGDEVVLAQSDPDGMSLVEHLYRGDPGKVTDFPARLRRSRQIFRIRAIDGSSVTLDRALRFDVRLAWKPQLLPFAPGVVECGVEGLGFEFPDRPYAGHFKELGANAVAITGAAHCWARDLRIHNADSGVFVRSAFCTLSEIVLTNARKPDRSGNSGHHGIEMDGDDCLCTRFEIETRFIHDLTVTHGAGNVFSEGRGRDLSLDHHRWAPYQNLFTALDAGEGSRLWMSGGTQGRGKHTGGGATFWNIKTKRTIALPDADFGGPGLIFAGLKTNAKAADVRPGWRLDPAPRVEPENLHAEQLRQRAGALTAR